MSDEQVVENNAEQVEVSPVESEARAAGWVPKEEYHGDENKWVDAAEFVRRGPLFEKINRQSSELKEVKKALEQLKAHHTKVRETEYKRAYEALKVQKKEALLDGDADRVIELDDKLDAVKDAQRKFEQEQAAEVAQATKSDIHPEFEAWTAKNTWYNSNDIMRAAADAFGAKLARAGMSPAEVLKQVEKEIRKEFPHKFENPNRQKPGAVEGGGKQGTGGKSERYELSSEEREVMNRFVRRGVMTEEQYIAELKKTKEIK